MDLETRKELEIFYETSDLQFDDIILSTFLVENEDLFLVGKKVCVEDRVLKYYFFPTGEDEGHLFIYFCQDEMFDSLIEDLDEDNFEIIARTWPLFGTAIMNGAEKKYLYPFITCIEDKWGLGIEINDIDIHDLDTPYVAKKAVKLINYAIDMFNEMDENDISTSDKIGYGINQFIKGYQEASTLSKLINIGLDLI